MSQGDNNCTVVSNTVAVMGISGSSTSMMEGTGSLEQQLATLRQRAGEVRARRADLRRLEELGMDLVVWR